MSQAFVREGDDQWLEDVAPTLNALSAFLSRENNGIRIHELKTITSEKNVLIHVMSNGLSYAKNDKGVWKVVE